MNLKVFKYFFCITFFMLTIVSAVVEFYPDSFFRKYSTVIIFPIITILYSLHSRNENYMYLLSFLFTYSGVFLYNMALHNIYESGLFLLLAGLLFYIKIIIKNSGFISLEGVVPLLVVFLCLIIIPTYFVLIETNMLMFVTSVLYTSVMGLLLLLAILNYKTNKNKTNTFLLMSAVSLILSTLAGGINYNIYTINIVRSFEVSLFILGHYFMSLYILSAERRLVYLRKKFL